MVTGRNSSRGFIARKRPKLTPQTGLEDFHNFYWYLDELVAFCRRHRLSTSGQKLDIVRRIEFFLKTGKTVTDPRQARKRDKVSTRRGPITMQRTVTDDFKCDEETRNFFKSVIGDHFHFTAHLQQFRRDKQNKGDALTYGDLVREWLADKERRKNKNYKSPLQRTWEYNRFVRDFMADRGRNRGKGIVNAARAWKLIRVHNGPRTYTEYKRSIVPNHPEAP